MRDYFVWFNYEEDERTKMEAFSEDDAIERVVQWFVENDTDYKGANDEGKDELRGALNASPVEVCF